MSYTLSPLDHDELTNKITYSSEYDSKIKRWLMKAIENVSGRKKIQRLYNELQAMDIAPWQVWEVALSQLSVTPVYDEAQMAKIPSEGPVLYISNHPFGVLDGLILGYLVSRKRTDFVVLVNEVLCRQDERLNKFLLPIDFRETKDAMQTNINTRNIALERLQQEGAVAIFPSGGVATSPNGLGKAEDLEWKRFTAKLIQKSQATVIPIYFHGQNSRLFQLVSQVSAMLRLSMLLYEVRNKMGTHIHINIGDPITRDALSQLKDRQQMIDHLRKVTFDLANG